VLPHPSPGLIRTRPRNANAREERGHPNAKGAKDSQRTQKEFNKKKIWILLRPLRDLCVLCVRMSAFLARIDAVSKLRPEYPGWMFERQAENRRRQLEDAGRG